MTEKTLLLFHVDDDENDRFFVARAVRAAALPIDVRNAACGEEALTMLRTAAILPHILLLDIKMPAMSGFEVLKAVKRDAAQLLVVMYSSSDHEEDIERARELGAHAYCVKPPGLEQLVEFVRRLYQAWVRSEVPCEWPAIRASEKN
jgi:DNA-binding NarL/FixJ family response regulator